VVTARENSNFALLYLVDKAMFLIDASGPTAAEFMLQRLGFSDARIRIALNIPDQTNNAESHRSILFHSPRKIFKRGRGKFQVSQRLPRARALADAPSLREDGASSSPT